VDENGLDGIQRLCHTRSMNMRSDIDENGLDGYQRQGVTLSTIKSDPVWKETVGKLAFVQAVKTRGHVQPL